MPKHVSEAALDTLLNYLAGSTRMDVVSDSTLPTNLGNSLANVSMGAGDFSVAPGDGAQGSRKLTMGAKPGVVVSTGGTPRHVLLTLSGSVRLVTTCTGPDLTEGSNVDFPSWKYEIAAPQ